MKKIVIISILLCMIGGPNFTVPLASGPEVEQKKVPGIAYEHYRNRLAPWSVHVLRIERNRPDYELLTSLGEGTKLGVSLLSEQMDAMPKELGTPIASLNGDFFRTQRENYSGDPRGLQIRAGELVSAPIDRACFWVGKDGTPELGEIESRFTATWPNGEKSPLGLNEERSWTGAVLYTPAIGFSTMTRGGTELVLERPDESAPWLPLEGGKTYRAKVKEVRAGGNTRMREGQMVLSIASLGSNRGAASAQAGTIVTISTETSPSIAGVRTAMGGGPMLVHESKPVFERVYKSFDRHPRSAFGWNKKEWLFVTVDGRQSDSLGMTLPEFAQTLVRLGCDEALNLDGGGSTELWLKGQVMNSPCYGERAMACALVIVEKKKALKP